jgi:hypothetical protein
MGGSIGQLLVSAVAMTLNARNTSSLSHSNTFLICWPISCAFIDYRPGAAATVLYL